MQESFNEWISKQNTRNDAIGDLARDVLQDIEFLKCDSIYKCKQHLIKLGASNEAIRTLKNAWTEYSIYWLKKYGEKATMKFNDICHIYPTDKDMYGK